MIDKDGSNRQVSKGVAAERRECLCVHVYVWVCKGENIKGQVKRKHVYVHAREAMAKTAKRQMNRGGTCVSVSERGKLRGGGSLWARRTKSTPVCETE